MCIYILLKLVNNCFIYYFYNLEKEQRNQNFLSKKNPQKLEAYFIHFIRKCFLVPVV